MNLTQLFSLLHHALIVSSLLLSELGLQSTLLLLIGSLVLDVLSNKMCIRDRITVTDKDGNALGVSKKAGSKAVNLTALTRIILPTPGNNEFRD